MGQSCAEGQVVLDTWIGAYEELGVQPHAQPTGHAAHTGSMQCDYLLWLRLVCIQVAAAQHDVSPASKSPSRAESSTIERATSQRVRQWQALSLLARWWRGHAAAASAQLLGTQLCKIW
jgi:hypothetical protein